MASDDPRRVHADLHIRDAIKILQAAQSKRLDHTGMTVIRTALEYLAIVLRSISGSPTAKDAQVAARLRQVAADLRACPEEIVGAASANLDTAAKTFQAMADRL